METLRVLWKFVVWSDGVLLGQTVEGESPEVDKVKRSFTKADF